MSPPPPQDGDTQGGDTRPLATLTVDEVCRLLAFLELGNSVPKFREADFNGRALAGASDQELKEIGIVSSANRARLLHSVKEFVANGVPTTAIGRCPAP
jgi:hypothetical protein